jgi:glyceraldehyde-3-phosphate dehydrogenase/erythrose-4-phosphate dehydrogenase
LLYAANLESHAIVVFRVDQNTGKLTPTGQVVEAGSPSARIRRIGAIGLRFIVVSTDAAAAVVTVLPYCRRLFRTLAG